jgi:hypothetical protein
LKNLVFLKITVGDFLVLQLGQGLSWQKRLFFFLEVQKILQEGVNSGFQLLDDGVGLVTRHSCDPLQPWNEITNKA